MLFLCGALIEASDHELSSAVPSSIERTRVVPLLVLGNRVDVLLVFGLRNPFEELDHLDRREHVPEGIGGLREKMEMVCKGMTKQSR